MSFQEKSIWVSLIITVLIFGFYFTHALIVFLNPDIPDEVLLGEFIGVIVLVIIMQIILQSILAIVNRKQAEKDPDERDSIIELKATRVSYFILVFGIWITCPSIFVINSPLIVANLILFFFILAETAGFIMQLFYYRRGI